jgi:hypothetical protein
LHEQFHVTVARNLPDVKFRHLGVGTARGHTLYRIVYITLIILPCIQTKLVGVNYAWFVARVSDIVNPDLVSAILMGVLASALDYMLRFCSRQVSERDLFVTFETIDRFLS